MCLSSFLTKTAHELVNHKKAFLHADFLRLTNSWQSYSLTEHFTNIEARNQEIDKLCEVQKCRSTDFEALNLLNLLSGDWPADF